MNKSTSFYLDFLRVIAAFGVLFVHANLPFFSNGLFLREELGHKLVMVFFVLSGYLIAFTVDKKNKGSRRYLIDRLSRLYSVIFPALFLTFILDFIGGHINPTAYLHQVAPGNQFPRYLLNATFLSQIWGLCTKPSSNGPFWSISYEFWYYMLFWAFCYLKGLKKYLVLSLISLLIGIKILILLPVWIFGVLAYKISARIQVNHSAALASFILTLLSIVFLTFFWDFSFFSKAFVFGQAPLYFSSRFVFDWVYGVLVAVNLFSVTFLSALIKIPRFVENVIKYLSSVTFSLYLYHAPLLIFVSALFSYDKSSYVQVLSIILGLVVIVCMLSQITEKQRNLWKQFWESVLEPGKVKPVKRWGKLITLSNGDSTIMRREKNENS